MRRYLFRRTFLFPLFFFLCGAIAAPPLFAHELGYRQTLIKTLQKNPLFDKEFLDTVFQNPMLQTHAPQRAPECTELLENYNDEYKITEKRSLEMGVKFYENNKEIFIRTEKETSVTPAYILGILRVETYFGICTGMYPVLPRLYHLYMKTPAKKDFALRQIKAFLEISKTNNWDPYLFLGSHAGAMGLFQFLPSSIKDYAVDGDKDGVINIYNPADCIPSIARYLVVNHWKRNKRASVWNYNQDKEYVERVITYAEKIAEEIRKKN